MRPRGGIDLGHTELAGALHRAKLDPQNRVTFDESHLRMLTHWDHNKLLVSAYRWEQFDRQLLTFLHKNLNDTKENQVMLNLKLGLREGRDEGYIAFDDNQLAAIDPDCTLRALTLSTM